MYKMLTQALSEKTSVVMEGKKFVVLGVIVGVVGSILVLSGVVDVNVVQNVAK